MCNTLFSYIWKVRIFKKIPKVKSWTKELLENLLLNSNWLQNFKNGLGTALRTLLNFQLQFANIVPDMRPCFGINVGRSWRKFFWPLFLINIFVLLKSTCWLKAPHLSPKQSLQNNLLETLKFVKKQYPTPYMLTYYI